MAETGPIPDTRDCWHCRTPIAWLWSPRVNDGLGGWVMYERVSDDGFTIRSHRCRPPSGDFYYRGSETPSVEPARPSPERLWERAGGDRERYVALMKEHRYLIPGKSEPLPCGWPHRRVSDSLPNPETR